MALELYNALGQLDIAAIDHSEVALLSEPQQQALAVLISKVQAREAAQERFSKAVRALGAATAEQIAALDAHVAVNPPQSFAQAQAAAIAAFNKSAN